MYFAVIIFYQCPVTRFLLTALRMAQNDLCEAATATLSIHARAFRFSFANSSAVVRNWKLKTLNVHFRYEAAEKKMKIPEICTMLEMPELLQQLIGAISSSNSNMFSGNIGGQQHFTLICLFVCLLFLALTLFWHVFVFCLCCLCVVLLFVCVFYHSTLLFR